MPTMTQHILKELDGIEKDMREITKVFWMTTP
jgi:hypothetical protein